MGTNWSNGTGGRQNWRHGGREANWSIGRQEKVVDQKRKENQLNRRKMNEILDLLFLKRAIMFGMCIIMRGFLGGKEQISPWQYTTLSTHKSFQEQEDQDLLLFHVLQSVLFPLLAHHFILPPNASFISIH